VLGDATPEWGKWGVLGTPLAFAPVDGPGDIVASALLFLGVMLLTQWLFLRPVRRAARPDGNIVRPRWHAVVAVAFIVMVLCTGLVATGLEMPNWWIGLVSVGDDVPWVIWGGMLALWIVWALVFFVYFRQGDFLAKTEVIVRALIRGSCLELLIAIPTHALVYRRDTDDCYCARGSYTGLVFGVAVLLWAFGPGLVLLALRERQRREPILRQLCPQCGAPLAAPGASASGCFQCGWRPAPESLHDR